MGVNYLTKLTSHYECDGTGDLIDSRAAQNWTEQGTVGLNSNDGPPKSTTSRGPCTSTTTGFQHTWSLGGPYDIRGLTSCWFHCWFRLDSKTTSQEIMAIWTTTANQQAVLFRWDTSLDTVTAEMKGAGATGPGVGVVGEGVGVWQHAGWYFDAQRYVFGCHLRDKFREIAGPSGGAGFPHTAQSQARIGVTVTGVSGSGLIGDIGRADWFKGYAPRPVDIRHFYNLGAGQRYPNQYKKEDVPLIVVAH